jgi:hypothetical protein
VKPVVQASGSGATAARSLLDDLPKLHDWGRGLEVGGLNVKIGQRIIAEVSRYDDPRIVETGAGASTLLFLCLEPRSITSIAPDARLHERILAAAEERAISVERLEFLCEQSELALPRLFALGGRFDVGLIDGCHGWPAVFVDFCYMNMMLSVGGTLLVDDVQLFSVAQLYLFLREQEEYEYVALDGKFATFRKVLDRPLMSDWRFQPYIERNTVTPPSP